jgi:hypothetical protein
VQNPLQWPQADGNLFSRAHHVAWPGVISPGVIWPDPFDQMRRAVRVKLRRNPRPDTISRGPPDAASSG